MANEELRYTPLWYRFEDDENFAVGLLNGVLAIVVMWLIERFTEDILFSEGKELSLSEGKKLSLSKVAAFVTLRGCSWRNLITWWKKPDLPENKERNEQTVTFLGRNRMALWGFLLRFLVTTLEVLVLFLTLWKRSYDVKEASVGTSQVTFGNGTELIHRTRNHHFSPCLTDRLEYAGFKSSAVREVCWERVLPYSAATPTKSDQQNSSIQRVRFRLRYDLRVGGLRIITRKEQYVIYHIIKFLEKDNRFLCRDRVFSSESFAKICSSAGDQGKHDWDIPTLLIPMEKNVPSAAAKAILKLNNQPISDCKIEEKQGLDVVLSCFVRGKDKEFKMLLAVLESIRTKRDIAKAVLKMYNGDEVENKFYVGTYKRPVLTAPLFAILIVLIFCMNLIYRRIYGSQDIVIKLFNLSQRAAGFTDIVKALHVQERKINLFENVVDGQEQGEICEFHAGFSSNETEIPTNA